MFPMTTLAFKGIKGLQHSPLSAHIRDSSLYQKSSRSHGHLSWVPIMPLAALPPGTSLLIFISVSAAPMREWALWGQPLMPFLSPFSGAYHRPVNRVDNKNVDRTIEWQLLIYPWKRQPAVQLLSSCYSSSQSIPKLCRNMYRYSIGYFLKKNRWIESFKPLLLGRATKVGLGNGTDIIIVLVMPDEFYSDVHILCSTHI